MELFYSTDIRDKKGCGIFPVGAAGAGAASQVVLSGSEAEHCAKVMRHKEGDIVFIIDGKGGLYNCRIEKIVLPRKGEAYVECAVLEESHGVGGRNYHLVMAVCPTKNMDRYEWFVEKSTELGVDQIVPVISEHSIRTSVKKERLEALALSATKQSLKSYLPEIADSISVSDFLNKCSCKDGEASARRILKLIAHCEDGDKKTIRQRLEDFLKAYRRTDGVIDGDGCQASKDLSVVIMIGPEGDFSTREIELALQKGFLPVTLGESRLRVETAAVVSVSEIYFASQG
ncbi:MAG: 16S rRNA (uracil(1498)-N(3))-methyltransferase [Bacteroidales bacterium]|nr:16S rRNA (uracil(1498)-N(3))-methyltransferase [Bacteroidales bacterium]